MIRLLAMLLAGGIVLVSSMLSANAQSNIPAEIEQ